MKKDNTYIMNLEAAYIYKDIKEGKKIVSKNRDLIKLFSATMPYSLETIRIDNMFPDAFYFIKKKQYTKRIINITFDKNYTVWDEEINKRKIIANKRKIRDYLYNNGFIIDGVKYVFYKRGPGKAKNGYALFIQEDLKEPLIKRSRLGLNFEENEEVDLTSLLAYETLISSGIDFTIELDPKTEILLIDDIYGKEIEIKASVTEELDGKIVTQNKKIKIQNCLTDGQGLLDESVFGKYDKANNGFMLLRSDMFKCCAFNTKLQAWFEYNQIKTVADMFGNTYEADKIKLVTTPNSLKFLKFAYKVGNGSKKECYEYWLDHIDNVFGVVKCDEETNYGNYNRTTYQLLNSIPNLTYDDLMEITKLEREYVMLLKNDNAVFRNYLCSDVEKLLDIEKSIEEDDISLYENIDLMNALLLVNSDVQYTKKFKKMKSDLVANYIKYLKRGKIRTKDAKYVTLFANPYEMLLKTINKYDDKSIMQGREIYCKYYKEGQDFCATRNPHVNSGNVMYTKNKYHKEYNDWFNFTDNICAINFFDNDAPDRLQGCDVDSDVFLLIPNKILANKAKYCEENFPTPINNIKGVAKPRKNNMKELQKLDVVLSDNYIGRIINLGQIINSYLNDAISKGESKEVIDELYQATSRLSSMSQIEIDKSKKVFDNVNMSKELSKIRQIKYLKFVEEKDRFDQIAKKMIVPRFFSMISDFNEYRIFEKFTTPLDILQDVLVFEGAKRLRGEKHKEFGDLLVSNSRYVDGVCRSRQFENIYNIVLNCGKRINGLKIKTCTLNNKAKHTIERRTKKDAIEQLKKLVISDATILGYLKLCFNKENNDYRKYSMLSLNLLFMAYKTKTLNCFKSKKTSDEEFLIKIKDKSDYNIFGHNYQKVKRKDLQ